MAEDPRYVEAWLGAGSGRGSGWSPFLGYLPFGILVIELRLPIELVVVWFIATGVALVGAGFCRCPRCRKHFFFGWWEANPLACRCLHCRLPKWATSDPNPPRVR